MVGKALAPAALALALAAAAAEAGVTEVWRQTRWGESSQALAGTFGARATLLDRPIEYGDSYVEVVLRDAEIAGYDFNVYFQMDEAGGGLKRIHFERPRHGAVLGVFRDVVAALEAELGQPAASCTIPPRSPSGYQAAITHVWRREGAAIRAVFRDTTVQATEGCLREQRSGTSPCGLTGHLFVQIGRAEPGAERC